MIIVNLKLNQEVVLHVMYFIVKNVAMLIVNAIKVRSFPLLSLILFGCRDLVLEVTDVDETES